MDRPVFSICRYDESLQRSTRKKISAIRDQEIIAAKYYFHLLVNNILFIFESQKITRGNSVDLN